MKWEKAAAAFLTTFLLSVGTVMIFIPDEINISSHTLIAANHNGVYRSITTDSNINKWWPSKINHIRRQKKSSAPLLLDGTSFSILGGMINGILVDIQDQDLFVRSSIKVVPKDLDSSLVIWDCSLRSGMNPLRRLSTYARAKKIKKDLGYITNRLKIFAEEKKNIYGIDIYQTLVIDKFLVTTKAKLNSYPGTEKVYELIRYLQQYISQKGALQTNHPMVHYTLLEDSRCEALVAVPVDRALSGNKDIIARQMMPGNILVANITGGTTLTKKAMQAMEVYIQDYQKSSPAIPFELLITDRILENDTSNWITRVSYPIY